jgi:hypothetical protein
MFGQQVRAVESREKTTDVVQHLCVLWHVFLQSVQVFSSIKPGAECHQKETSAFVMYLASS